MMKIRSKEELNKLRDVLKAKAAGLAQKDNSSSIIQVKVTMSTCGIASGSRPIFDFFKEELAKRNIPAKVSQSGCMGFCYAEPTVEITIPGENPVIFGFVTNKKADEIIERFIRKGELVEGIIPQDYETVIFN
ncbi:MAG: (2Fe-2S) ferredoxin domain-containing protein [Bacteroidales bacterium]|jgi:NADP-reducing hydrogenase subunit HndB|nr:(2Fe-2S) ferredoxin domain-containing protein [Bacteroidales bacterium]